MKKEGTVRDGWKSKSFRIALPIGILILVYPFESLIDWAFVIPLALVIAFELMNSTKFQWDEEKFALKNKLSKDRNYRWSDVSSISDDLIDFHIYVNKKSVSIRKKETSDELMRKLENEMETRANKTVQTTRASARV